MSKMPTALIFGGGGVRCLSYIGVIKALEERDLLEGVTDYAGSSFGAVIATALSVGFKHVELYDFIKSFKYEDLQDISFFDFYEKRGFESGDRIEKFLKLLLKVKTGDPNLTFDEHHKLTGKKLQITATCVTDDKVVYLNWETSPDLEISTALRMSISIPIIFRPVQWRDKLYVDGGLKNNFPMNLYQSDSATPIGVCIDDGDNPDEDYYIKLMRCVYDDVQKFNIGSFNRDHVIKLKCIGSLLQFSYTRKQRRRLHDDAYEEAEKWLSQSIYGSNQDAPEMIPVEKSAPDEVDEAVDEAVVEVVGNEVEGNEMEDEVEDEVEEAESIAMEGSEAVEEK
jgi:predicted acylesterase/phospholipase RssA